MSSHEVTGTLSWDDPEPVAALDSVYALPIVNNQTPVTEPYIAPTAVWAPGGSGDLPTFTGWAVRGSRVSVGSGSEGHRHTWRYLELSRAATAVHYRVTFEFDSHDDLVLDFHQNIAGPYRIRMPNDTLLNVVVESISTPAYE